MSRWKVKFNNRKSRSWLVGKWDAGVSWKIGEEKVEAVEGFKYFGMWVDGCYEVMFS